MLRRIDQTSRATESATALDAASSLLRQFLNCEVDWVERGEHASLEQLRRDPEPEN